MSGRFQFYVEQYMALLAVKSDSLSLNIRVVVEKRLKLQILEKNVRRFNYDFS